MNRVKVISQNRDLNKIKGPKKKRKNQINAFFIFSLLLDTRMYCIVHTYILGSPYSTTYTGMYCILHIKFGDIKKDRSTYIHTYYLPTYLPPFSTLYLLPINAGDPSICVIFRLPAPSFTRAVAQCLVPHALCLVATHIPHTHIPNPSNRTEPSRIESRRSTAQSHAHLQ